MTKLQTGSSGAVLSKLFIKILQDNGVLNSNGEGLRFGVLMESYLSDPRNGVPASSKARSGVRTNMKRSLLDKEMTWKTFFDGLLFLNVADATFSIIVDTMRGEFVAKSSFNVNQVRKPDPHTLSDLFRQIRIAKDADVDTFGVLVEEQLRRSKECEGTGQDPTVVKNYKLKELLAPVISWKTLMKDFSILKIENFYVNIEIVSIAGKHFSCGFRVNTGANTEMEFK